MTLNASGIVPVTYDVNNASLATGTYTGDGSGSIQVFVGFTPKMVKIIDVTDVTTYEWVQGMPATNSIKVVTAGTVTIDTNSAVLTDGKLFVQSSTGQYQPPGGAGSGTIINSGNILVWGTDPTLNYRCVFGAVANVSGKSYVWYALGG
jgi:hypothetical protein